MISKAGQRHAVRPRPTLRAIQTLLRPLLKLAVAHNARYTDDFPTAAIKMPEVHGAPAMP